MMLGMWGFVFGFSALGMGHGYHDSKRAFGLRERIHERRIGFDGWG